MGKNLTDLTTQEERELALASAERLGDFDYPLTFPEDTNVFNYSGLLEEEEDKNKSYWTNVSRIACVRFPKLQEREFVRMREIKNRFNQLKNAGYEVPAYSSMKKKELWKSLMKIRAEIYEKLDTDYPDIKEQIKRINKKKR